MNSLTLRHRLLFLTLLPSTLIAVALVAYFTLTGIRTLEGELRVKGLATVRYLAPISEYGIIAGQNESLSGLAQATLQEPGIKAAVIVNQNGRLVAIGGRVSLSSEQLRAGPAAPSLVADTERWVAFGAPVRRSTTDADLLFDPATSPGAAGANSVIGHVFVEYDKTELLERQRQLLQRGLLIVLIGLLVLAALAIAMADNLGRPLMRLVQAVNHMSSGKLNTRVAVASSGELGVLENGFNEMASRIEEVHLSMQTRIEEATAQLAYQARHDALTGLLNRREFELCLEKALAAVHAGNDEYSLLFFDLDRFKQVNDACGYLAGDELLRQTALLLQGRLRQEDILARLGGDEFCVILNHCDARRARQVAEDIRDLASAFRFIWQDKVFTVGASIGVTTINHKVRNIQEIIAAGDAACQRAKESGRNRVCEQIITPQQERRREHSNWAGRIAAALDEGYLLVEAMPLRGLQAEADEHVVQLTARLNEPGQPPVALAALTDAAERYELATSIDRCLIDAAIDALARVRNMGRQIYCLVPLSRGSIGRRETEDYIGRQLAEHGLSGRQLCFVFSEDILTHMTSRAMEFALQMRALGCRIGLDDFGAGLPSFSHLRGVNPCHVILSHSLTRDLGGNRSSTALLRAVQEIAADQNIRTIASDVDEPEVVERLRRLGIDYAQGKAVAPSEPFEAWLEGAVMRAAFA